MNPTAPNPITKSQIKRNKRQFGRRARHHSSNTRINFGALQAPYVDDDTDLVLKSEDGVEYPVQASALKTASGVFKDMLASSAARPADTTPVSLPEEAPSQPPIEISSPSLVVRLFVDLMYHNPLLNTFTDLPPPGPAPTPAEAQAATAAEDLLSDSTPTTHFADIFRKANEHLTGRQNGVACLAALLELLDRFDCRAGMRERALAHFEPIFHLNPWAVFVIAAKYEDVELAKKAISKFWGYTGEAKWRVQPQTMKDEDIRAVDVRWLMGYNRAHAKITQVQGHLGAAVKDTDEKFYKDVAAAFTLETPEPPTPARTQVDTNQRNRTAFPGGYSGNYAHIATPGS